MGDGTSRRIADVRRGGRVYGTVPGIRYRRLVRTRVLSHWRTLKQAYRVTTSDGRTVIASGDHRFLTARGWKHVAPDVHPFQRPHLTLNDHLAGIGSLSFTPRATPAYEAGYLCGMVRGDAHVGTHLTHSGARESVVHQFRLALTDVDGLARSKQFLERLGVTTRQLRFPAASATRREMIGIRTQRRRDVDRVRAVREGPVLRSDEWRRGFLAGIFDAEGSHDGIVLRITNTDLS